MNILLLEVPHFRKGIATPRDVTPLWTLQQYGNPLFYIWQDWVWL